MRTPPARLRVPPDAERDRTQRRMERAPGWSDPATSSYRSGLRSGLSALHLGPRVAQADRAVEDRAARLRIRVAIEVALALELHGGIGVAAGDGGLQLAIVQHFERIRVEVGREVAGIRIGTREQGIVEAHFGRYRVGRRDPMNGRLDLAAV